MKKILALALALVMLCSFMTAATFAEGEKTPATFLFVATNGADTNNGAEATPFATLAKAIDAAKAIDGTVVINIREGVYEAADTIELTAENNDLVIRAYGDENVVISGSKDIPYSAFKKVTDKAVTDRIITKSAREKVMAADLKALRIENYGEIANCGFGITSSYPASLTYKDRYQTLAQYPNGTDYIYTSEILDDGSKNERNPENNGFPVKYTVRDTRYKQWEAAEDAWAIGWYVHDWAESITPVKIDVKTGAIEATSGYSPVKTDRRVKFFNLLEELDQPGEYYIDREKGILYMILPEGFAKDEVLKFSCHDKDFITLTGCENITIQGIRFEGTTKRGIYGEKCKNCVVNDCELTAIGAAAVTFKEGYDCVIENSYIHDIGSSGASVEGGDAETLTKGNNIIRNCHIERFMCYKLTYAPAVSITGVGSVASHNEINTAPHEGIAFSGQYNIFEYNDVYDVCKDSSDAGAIYTGRHWEHRNNEIRHNYFHDLEMIDATTGYEMQAVYLDDMHSNTFVYGNVFYKCDSVALYGGGRDNTFTNNVMLDCKKPFVMDARGTTWMQTGPGSQIYNFLMESPWKNELWQKTFPELAEVLDNGPTLPMNNIIKDNLILNTPDMDVHELAIENGTFEPAVAVSKKDFVDYANENFALKEDSEIFKKIPEFKQIEMDKIGRYDYTVEEKWENKGELPEAEKPAPAPSSKDIKVLLDGEAIVFDVQPTILNNRTMVPLRAIFEALGAKVDWDADTKTVTAVKDDTTIVMQIGNSVMKKNDVESTLDSAPVILNNRTLVPVRAIAESFGNKVDWEAETRTVLIASK